MQRQREKEKMRGRVVIKKASPAEMDNYWYKVEAAFVYHPRRTKGHRQQNNYDPIKLEYDQRTTFVCVA